MNTIKKLECTFIISAKPAEIVEFSANCSAAAQNIKMGWFFFAYDDHPRDKKPDFFKKHLSNIIGCMVIIYVNNVNYVMSIMFILIL